MSGKLDPAARRATRFAIKYRLGAEVADNDIVGYTIAYDQEEIQFPVYILTVIAAGLLGAAAYLANPFLLVLGFAAGCATLYNFPLIETGKPRFGAGQYGIFIEGLGLVEWRVIDRIEIVPDVVRGITFDELEIELKTAIGKALIIDWRKRPIWRWGMRLPYKMRGDKLIRITLGVLDRPPQEIQETFLRMWRYHRGATGVVINDGADGDEPAA